MKQLSPEVLSPVNIIGADIRYVMYKLDDETIVQKYQYKATLEEIEKEKAAATNTLRLGLPTVISFEPVQIGDDYGIVYERMGSGSLGNLIMSHPSRFIDYVGDFVALEHRMHATHVDKDAFPSAKQTISDLYDEALERGVYTADEVAAVGRMLAAIPDRDTYLHLSCGPRTTRYVDGELTLTQVVDASYGHPRPRRVLDRAADHHLRPDDPRGRPGHAHREHQRHRGDPFLARLRPAVLRLQDERGRRRGRPPHALRPMAQVRQLRRLA
jgi:hypothetical protein